MELVLGYMAPLITLDLFSLRCYIRNYLCLAFLVRVRLRSVLTSRICIKITLCALK
jgi:hypothetical protein